MSAEARRAQLLDVTKAIVVERGFHAVSIDGVAREAGITRPVVYGHFTDLPGLLEALVEREGERALAQLGAVLPAALSERDPRERLVAALGGYLEAVRADPATWRLVLMPHEGAPRVLHEHISRGRAAVVGQLAAALGGTAAAGVSPPGRTPAREPGPQGRRFPGTPDPELAARLLAAFADEAARLLLAEPERYPADRILRLARWFVARL
jgi:AcrR family transcriptional regulator